MKLEEARLRMNSMTEKNRLQYIYSRAKRVQNSINKGHIDEQYIKDTMSLIWEFYYHIMCTKCSADDIGYCYFRGSRSIPELEKYLKYCLPNFILNAKTLLDSGERRLWDM
jgi:hypothetical protein